MPKIVFYKEQEWVPVLDWMTELKHQDKKAFFNGIAQLSLLQEQGHKLERPSAAYLEEGIYELRWKHVHAQYRILYFFNGRDFIVLTHAIVKKGSEVPEKDIKRALKRKRDFEINPKLHTFEATIPADDEGEPDTFYAG